MSWLRSLFAQSEIIARLRFERDFYSTNCKELETKLQASEARLRTEINSNRRREDAYKAELAAQTAPQMRLPFRDEVEDTQIEVFDDGIGPTTSPEVINEENVRMRAEEFAESYGVPVTEQLLDYLRHKIRANPDEYLNN